MVHILETLLHHHDGGLVLVAAVICTLGAVATFAVAARAGDRAGSGLWLSLLAVCSGATVWATHFIAMLAYRSATPLLYSPGLTAGSFLVGAAVMGAGFGVAVRPGRRAAGRAAAGMIVGAGVVLLHYVGMAAAQVPGGIAWHGGLVALSIVFSLGFGAAALVVGINAPVRVHARPAGTLLFVLMIVSLHFTAMAAAELKPVSAALPSSGGFEHGLLAAAIAVAALSVLGIGVAAAIVDRQLAQRLETETERFRTFADGAFEGIVVHRAGAIVDANAAARLLLGLPAAGEDGVIGDWREIAGTDEAAASRGVGQAVELELRRTDGSRFTAEICRREISLPDGAVGELCAIRDLTARKEAEARIAHLALHDPLTELPNRRFFEELAQKAIAQAKRTGESLAVMTIDIDDLKLTNDMHGHAAGDELIRVAARRIASALRDADVCARFGGDEFAVLQRSADEPQQAVALADRLLDVLAAPIRLDAVEITIGASIGVAMFPDDGSTADDLLRNADTAMYRAKAEGKGLCRFFEPQMDAALVVRRRLEQALRQAVMHGRLWVEYQPIVDVATRSPLAFEALVRWRDPELGTISPGEFIPVAEETGLIVPIGEFVLQQACRDAMLWPAPLRVSVNLSAVQFRRRGLVESVTHALHESGLPGDRLQLEITETLLLDNRTEALRILGHLKALGVRMAMDDFGTGYSSLSYLQSFPFDTIKIDRIFLSDLPSNSQNASIVRAVAALGKSLHMRVVAEGVETDVQADMLADLDCDELQGFLIARPMPVARIADFLAAHTLVNRTRA